MLRNERIIRLLIFLGCFALLVPIIANNRPLAVCFVPSGYYESELSELRNVFIPDYRLALKTAANNAGGESTPRSPNPADALNSLEHRLAGIRGLLNEEMNAEISSALDKLRSAKWDGRQGDVLLSQSEVALQGLERELSAGRALLRTVWCFPAWNSVGWPELGLLIGLLALSAWLAGSNVSTRTRHSGKLAKKMLFLLMAMACLAFKLRAGSYDLDFASIRGSSEVKFYLASPVPYSSTSIDLGSRFSPPDGRHPLGTDSLGRDLLSRLVWGARVSLTIALLALGIQLFLGTFLGGLAVIPARWACALFSRLIDGLICIPPLFLALAVGVILGANLIGMVAAIALAGSLPVAQLFRAELRRINGSDYVSAARNLGLGRLRIFRSHMLPNALAPVFGHVGYGVAGSILMESSLSFLGLGIQAPAASWGGILSEVRGQLELWWIMLFPGLCIILTVALVQKAAGQTQLAMAVKSSQA